MDNYTITNKNFIGRKVALIKEIRNAFNIGLKDAKDVADQMEPHTLSSTLIYGVTVHDEQAFRNIASTGEIRDYFNTNNYFKEEVKQKLKEIIRDCMEEGEYTLAESLLAQLKNI